MNSMGQTAQQIGQEYSAYLKTMLDAYEELSGTTVGACDQDFWEQKEVVKVETLIELWFQIDRINHPTDYYFEDTYLQGDTYEEN